jgi:Protein of unknown function (DUF1326)
MGPTRAFLVLAVGAAGIALAPPARTAGTGPDWAMNATVIEACSCPMFCQCYFNTKPAAHHEHGGAEGGQHFCRANLAYKVNKGYHGKATLDGAKFWLSNDLGADFSKGQMDWAVLTFDKTVTKEQREALTEIVSHLFPVKWNSFKVAEGSIDTWAFDKDKAVATLDGGKTGEIRLHRFAGMTDEPVVIKNLRYWGAPRNDGFVLMPSDVEAYRAGSAPFEYKGTNGFMITVDINSKDVAGPAGK